MEYESGVNGRFHFAGVPAYQGYASDALNLLCDYAFDFLQIHQLYAHVATENEASMKLFASCGFAQCGLLKDWLSTSEGYKDAALMQRIKITLNESGK